jgi:hypothetical protein
MSTKSLLRSFAGGEITNELAGRLDLTAFQTGLSLCRNFITLPHGPATRRPGFEFVNEAKTSASAVRLIPFSFSATQTVVLEFGDLYVRFHIGGATLLEATVAITSIVGSLVTTTASHGYATGDWVYIGSRWHKVTVTAANTFTTKDLWAAATTASGSTSARAYTLTSTYAAADLFDLHFAQSADIITIVHPTYPARELARLGATDWTLTDVSFAAPSDVPLNVAVTPTVAVATNLTGQNYGVTAVASDGVTESLMSASASAANNLTLAGNFNTVTWDAVAGSTRYNVYKQRGGTYGYIGQIASETGALPITITSSTPYDLASLFVAKRVRVVTAAVHGYTTGNIVLLEGTTYFDGSWSVTVENTTTFTFARRSVSVLSSTGGTASVAALTLKDDNVLADTTKSPPEDIIALNSVTGDYPSATTYHEQRRWFAGTNDKPQVLWATRTGTEANLTSSIPSQEADGMELRVANSQYNQIRHLVPLSDLIALTAGGEFRVFAEGAPAVTPTSVSIKPQGYSGSSNVQPVVTSGSILYVQAQGSRLRELAYNWESSAYRTIDISVMAPHRFNGHTITQLAFSRAPDPMLWAVRDDGTMLGMTYLPDQKVFGWHAHDTDGTFESVCVVAEGNEDVLYAVVKRTVNARTVRYIERLRTRIFTELEDAFFVDSGLTYDSTPTTTLSGLYHLEGQTVDILADGAVEVPQVVTGGAITLGTAASKIHVGLGFTSDLRTLPLAIEGMQGAGQGTMKNINKVHLRVSQSALVKAGPDFTRLREYPARAVSDPYGSPPALRDGELSLSVDPSWNTDAAICVRQDLPVPLTVLSMTLDLQTGG